MRVQPGGILDERGGGREAGDAARVVIASAGNVEEIAAKLGDGYLQNFYGLRPEVVLALFVRRYFFFSNGA